MGRNRIVSSMMKTTTWVNQVIHTYVQNRIMSSTMNTARRVNQVMRIVVVVVLVLDPLLIVVLSA